MHNLLASTSPSGQQRYRPWHPALASERRELYKLALINLALVVAFIWTLVALYFGSYFRQTENAYRLTVRILDLDSQYTHQTPGAANAILGPAVVRAAINNGQAYPKFHLGWQIPPVGGEELNSLSIIPGGQGINGSQYAMDLVTDQTVFGTIVINPNATRLALEAAQQGNPAYDPRGAVSFFYEEARNFYSTNQYVVRFSTSIIEAGIAEAAMELTSQLLTTATTNGATGITELSTAAMGNALSYQFYHSTWNLRPFDELAGEAATTAGQIYLIIFTFFASPIWKKAFEPLRSHLTYSSQMILQIAVPIISYFWISFNYSLVTMAFRVDFRRRFGVGGWPLFWLNNWISMSALGLVMETMLRLLGPMFFPFFLLAWTVSNVSVAFLDLADMDRWYSYGFVSPVWNSIDATKCIIFGTKNHILQNFMVNLGWIIVFSVALVAVATYQRNKEEKQNLQTRTDEITEKRKEQQSHPPVGTAVDAAGMEDAIAGENHNDDSDSRERSSQQTLDGDDNLNNAQSTPKADNKLPRRT